MNADQIERLLLLAESGELSARQSGQLERELSLHPGLRERADALRRLGAQARAALAVPLAAVPAVPVRAWMDEGALSRPSLLRFPAVTVPTGWWWAKRLAAAAAVLTLVAGGWLLLRGAPEESDAVDELQTLVAFVSTHSFVADAALDDADAGRIRGLARHLLLMEGFASEPASVEAPALLDAAPTTLRWRSSGESPQERCG